MSAGRVSHGSKSQSATTELIIPTRPIRWPSSGEKMVTPDSRRRLISAGTMTPPPPPTTLTWSAPGRAQRLDEVLEVLDVAALVGRDGDALGVLLERGVHDLLDRAVVPEVDHLAALAHEDPPHDVDRGVVAVEQG